MFRNYLKTAWRNLQKNKAFSFINIFGLAIGLSCFLLITIYVLDELSYDKSFKDGDRIYRVESDIKFGGDPLRMPITSDVMGALLKKDYPQVEQYTRIYTFSGAKLIKKGNEYINEFHVGHVDSTFFSVFQLQALAGDLKTALNEPNTAVITESAAKKYFGTANAVGKVLETSDRNKTAYKVTGIVRDFPHNVHFHLDMLFSMDNVNYEWNSPLSHNFYTYLLLKKGTDAKAFQNNFKQYIDKYVVPAASQAMNIKSIEDFERAGNKLEYSLRSLHSIHLHSDRSYELSANGSIQYVYIFSAVALFILLIACINFMNLATARSATRAKEVGVRKVLGTERKNLIVQFLSESTLMAVVAMLIAIALTLLALPYFNDLSGKTLNYQYMLNWKIASILVLLPFVVGMLAGSYPAFFLSSFQPIQVLKGKLNVGTKNIRLRSVLVVFQFTTSIILIVGTIVMFRQMNFIQNKNLGFNKDQVLIINDAYALGNNVQAFKKDLLNMPGITSGSVTGFLPVSSSNRNDNSYSKNAVIDATNGVNMQTWYVDYDYLKTMGMNIKEGRFFSQDFGSDSSAVVINEAAAKLLALNEPLGKKIYNMSDLQTQEVSAFNIIGVVKDFHFESLRQNIGPLCFRLGKNTYMASFKVKTDNMKSLLQAVEAKWKSMAPGFPFSYRFLDDAFDEMYRAERRMSTIALVFAVLAILVACLGLFGLSTFMAEQRTKEIGIRKVLGADVKNLVAMLSKDFLKLVLIAALIAFPIAGWVMHKWLQDFAYRTPIAWWMYLFAGTLALMIALLTVSFQAMKAALMNPVKSLRTE